MIERVAEAINEASLGYNISLTRLVDRVSTYTLTDSDRLGPIEFPSHSDALEYITAKIRLAKARAAIKAMREPTEEMVREGRFSIGVFYDDSSDAEATSVFTAMIDAALKENSK
jgi:hypothetical protein